MPITTNDFRYSILIGSLLIVGCSGDQLSTLTGTITIDGEPAPRDLSLVFDPIAEDGLPSYGTTDDTGYYEAQFTFKKDGIQSGEHLVHLGPNSFSEPMPMIGPDGKPVAGDPSSNPLANIRGEYYQEIDTIMIESGTNEWNFDLKTK